MKKLMIGTLILAVFIAVLGSASNVFAQTATPNTTTPTYGFGNGRNNMNGRGQGYGNRNTAPVNQSGLLQEYFTAAYAEKLGLSVDALNARLAKGETLAQIAAANGMNLNQFQTFMAEARALALDNAVKDGKITQQQADWMKTRGISSNGNFNNGGNRRGPGNGNRGNRGNQPGSGLRQNANPLCPYYTPTAP